MMKSEQLRSVGVNDKIRQKETNRIFTVIAKYSHDSVIVAHRYKQITKSTVNRWKYENGKSIPNISSLKQGDVIVSITNVKFVIGAASDNHAHAYCTLVIRDDEAHKWQLHAASYIRVVHSFE